MGLLRCGCGLWVSWWRLVWHGSWVMALSSPMWVVGCGSWIDVDRGGSAGLESVASVGFWIGVDHGGSWWVVVDLGLRIVVDQRIWSSRFFGFFFFFFLVVAMIDAMCTQTIKPLGLTPIWAHNLFVLWAFGFPTVSGPMLDRPKYASIFSHLSLFLTESLFCFLWVFTLFS